MHVFCFKSWNLLKLVRFEKTVVIGKYIRGWVVTNYDSLLFFKQYVNIFNSKMTNCFTGNQIYMIKKKGVFHALRKKPDCLCDAVCA